MNEALRNRLVHSLIDKNLVVFCGAGLSMCGTSPLPSAAQLAAECYANYYQKYANQLPEALQWDLEALCGHFYSEHELQRRFLGIVPWHHFHQGVPNIGHAAVADFLACSTIPFSASTNYDTLIEAAADQLGEAVFFPTTGIVGNALPAMHAPFLKVHGCARLTPTSLLWCKEQLDDTPIRGRLDHAKTYLSAALAGKDVVFVGFWSDWSYLNEVFSEALGNAVPSRVVLADTGAPEILSEKAPRLWTWAQRDNIAFDHVQQSADEFLDELRQAYSQNFLDRLVLRSRSIYQSLFGEEATLTGDITWPQSTSTLYNVRRALTGATRTSPVRRADPVDSILTAGAALIYLLQNGGVLVDDLISLGSLRIRIVAGKGVPLSMVKSAYIGEANDLDDVDVTICAGAINDGAARADIVRDDRHGSVVRGGLSSRWVTLEQAVEELGIES